MELAGHLGPDELLNEERLARDAENRLGDPCPFSLNEGGSSRRVQGLCGVVSKAGMASTDDGLLQKSSLRFQGVVPDEGLVYGTTQK